MLIRWRKPYRYFAIIHRFKATIIYTSDRRVIKAGDRSANLITTFQMGGFSDGDFPNDFLKISDWPIDL